LFLTPLFRNLQEATLAAIVIVAISGMIKGCFSPMLLPCARLLTK
jgi:hypothetical protein